MKIFRPILFVFVLCVYGALFVHNEKIRLQTEPELSIPLPSTALKTVLGYIRQLGSEMHFIKTSVFLGALDPDKPVEKYADSLVSNFNVMVDLHPHFRDTYFLAESALAHIGPRQARETNKILAKGMAVYPDDWQLPFFKGFNHFFYLKENREAADDLLVASKLPEGPSWLAHLASMLKAEGGDIRGGLAWLAMMLKTEEDPVMQERYKEDIVVFQKALVVQEALFAYRNKYNQMPAQLSELIPEFLTELPWFDGKYELEWDPPDLRLTRPHTKRIAQ